VTIRQEEEGGEREAEKREAQLRLTLRPPSIVRRGR
jgi:hypothetical protein